MAKSVKWNTLQHKGPLFPEIYKPMGLTIDGHTIPPEMEERLYKYAGYTTTEYWTKPTFIKNAEKAILEVLPEGMKNKYRFPNDFIQVLADLNGIILQRKEAKKNISKEEKEAEKARKDQLKEEYGYAILDGKKVPLGAFMIEASGPFITRGVHPMLGTWKKMAMPEDIRINLSKGEKIPEHPFPGHNWQKVEENKNAMWILDYDVPGSKAHKFIGFSYNSDVKQKDIEKKYEASRNLLLHWDEVEKYIHKHLNFRDVKTSETAIVAYLIMKLGIRIGNEKDEDEADTVGASTLRKENLKMKPNHVIELDFLGKDSIRYTNSVAIDEDAYNELELIYRNKKPNDLIFPSINSSDVNTFLQEALPGLSAKQFRSAHGSGLLCEELKVSFVKNGFKDEATLKKAQSSSLVKTFQEANLKVAQVLNHKKTINKEKLQSTLEKLDSKVAEKKEKIEENQAKNRDKMLELEKEILTTKKAYTGDKLKEKLDLLKEKRNKILDKIEKETESLKNLIHKKSFKEKSMDSALGTSLNSYIDPRIVISWCNTVGLPIEKIYTKSGMGKLNWAINVSNDFWLGYPAKGN